MVEQLCSCQQAWTFVYSKSRYTVFLLITLTCLQWCGHALLSFSRPEHNAFAGVHTKCRYLCLIERCWQASNILRTVRCLLDRWIKLGSTVRQVALRLTTNIQRKLRYIKHNNKTHNITTVTLTVTYFILWLYIL